MIDTQIIKFFTKEAGRARKLRQIKKLREAAESSNFGLGRILQRIPGTKASKLREEARVREARLQIGDAIKKDIKDYKKLSMPRSQPKREHFRSDKDFENYRAEWERLPELKPTYEDTVMHKGRLNVHKRRGRALKKGGYDTEDVVETGQGLRNVGLRAVNPKRADEHLHGVRGGLDRIIDYY